MLLKFARTDGAAVRRSATQPLVYPHLNERSGTPTLPTGKHMSVIDHIRVNKRWAKHAFRFEDLASPITRIHFVSHPGFEGTEDYPIESPTNHWTLSLTLSDTGSVRVEVVPIDPGKPGVLLVESEKGPVTGGSVHLVSGDVLSRTTVEDFLDVVIKRKRDYYTFAPIGEGCRYWLSALSKDLVEENIIGEELSDTAIDAMNKYWPMPIGTPPIPRPVAQGHFHG